MIHLTARVAIVATAAVVALFAADATFAAPASLKAAFGNTVVSTYPDGRTGLLWMKADGTYTAAGRRRHPSSGVWTVKGEKVCLKQQKPRAAPFAYCTAFPSGDVGASWSGRAVTGEKIRIKLVAGRVDP